MGSRGPQPLPANVHVLRGNPSKKSAEDLLGDFNPEIEIPSCPAWCWKEAKKEWKRITPELEQYGLISKVDRAALTLYCQAWAEFVFHKQRLSADMTRAEAQRAEAEARGEIYKGGDGISVATPNGGFTYSHHWVCARRAEDQVNKFLAAFGMSPSARGRVRTSDNRQQTLFEQPGMDAWKL